MFSKSVDLHGRNLRTQYNENYFRIDRAKNWNSLPLNLRKNSSTESFKKSLIEYFGSAIMLVTYFSKF